MGLPRIEDGNKDEVLMRLVRWYEYQPCVHDVVRVECSIPCSIFGYLPEKLKH